LAPYPAPVQARCMHAGWSLIATWFQSRRSVTPAPQTTTFLWAWGLNIRGKATTALILRHLRSSYVTGFLISIPQSLPPASTRNAHPCQGSTQVSNPLRPLTFHPKASGGAKWGNPAAAIPQHATDARPRLCRPRCRAAALAGTRRSTPGPPSSRCRLCGKPTLSTDRMKHRTTWPPPSTQGSTTTRGRDLAMERAAMAVAIILPVWSTS